MSLYAWEEMAMARIGSRGTKISGPGVKSAEREMRGCDMAWLVEADGRSGQPCGASAFHEKTATPTVVKYRLREFFLPFAQRWCGCDMSVRNSADRGRPLID